jgi:hypothetical protein
MMKNYLLLIASFFVIAVAHGQLRSAGQHIIDDINKEYPSNESNAKRSIQNPKTCGVDTIEYARYKASSLFTVAIAKGQSLGQLYSAPKPVTVSGFTFYSFVLFDSTRSNTMNLICKLYKAGADSLPKGLPLRTDTIFLDTTLGGGRLSVIQKQAFFTPITMDSSFIITVETDNDSVRAGVVTNSYRDGDGDFENLNCGSISGLWYNGKNLNIGGTPFNCDILLHPYVKYNFGTDFTIKNDCYNINDSVSFINAAASNMSGSKMYNRYLLYNLDYYCHLWNAGNTFGSQYNVNHKVKYSSQQNYSVRLISRIYGYNGPTVNGCVDTTIHNIYFKPAIPTYSGIVNACLGDSVRYTAISIDTGVDYEWLRTPASNPYFTGTSYLQNPITQNDTFYLRANNHGCLSGLRMVVIRANQYPTTLQVLNDSVCSGSKANLKATADIGIVNWYAQLSGGLPFYSGNVFQTNVLMADTSFYVQASNLGCVLNPRIPVRALVGSSFAPSPPIVSNDTTVCLASGNVITLSANAASGLSIRWFDAASGGTSINTGTTFNFLPTKREVKIYYADAFNGVCGSTRVPINITVEHYPTPINLKGDVICKGDSARLSYLIPYGKGQWFDAPTAGNLLQTGMSYTSLPNASTDFYIETSSDICVNPVREKITAVVNTYPAISKIWADTICAKNQATLKTKYASPGTIEWFETDTSRAALDSGSTFLTPVLNGNRSYYARSKYAGCIGPKINVNTNVLSAPFSGFYFDVLTWQQVRVSPINAANSTILWDFGDGTTSTLNQVTHRYTNTGNYNIKLTLTSIATSCPDSTTVSVQIDPSSIHSVYNLNELKLYPNPFINRIYFPVNSDLTDQNLVIYDLKGQILYRTKLESDLIENGLLLPELKSGVYFIKIDGFKASVMIR